MRLYSFILFLLTFALLSGCGVVPRGQGPSDAARPNADSSSGGGERARVMAAVSPARSMQASLEQAYRDWRGTPYVLGGASREGVDCSRFVSIVFDRYFGVEVADYTREQLQEGRGVNRGGLRPGDLVFFRTGRATLHVGIIVEGEEFLHASTSQGVMVSSLDEAYWSSRYLTARRVM